MFRSYRIGSLAGFPIEVNLSFLFLLGLVLLFMGGLGGVLAVLILFASVLVHELGHAVVARRLGVGIAGIELSFFGGAAKMVGQPRTADHEVLIAAAGPAVSFGLGGLGFVLASLTGIELFQWFGWINLILGAFNLVPALPMDGGRILRALLTRRFDYLRATEVSITVARGFAILFGVIGLGYGHWFLAILAVLIWFLGSAELRMAQLTGHQFSYDRNGYRHSGPGYGDVEVLPHDADPFGRPLGRSFGGQPAGQSGRQPFFSVHRPMASGGFVIRQRNGRLVIERIP